MQTQAHLIMAAALFARPGAPKVTWAALAGGFIPDVSLYVLSLWSRFAVGNPWEYVFGTQYFSNQWQAIFAVDNSFFVYAALIALGLFLRREWLWVFAAAAFIHLCFDFPLHNDDARQHFWPLSDWVFISPLSYWDPNHHGGVINLMEMVLILGLLLVLWVRFKTAAPRIFIGVLLAAHVLFLVRNPWLYFGF